MSERRSISYLETPWGGHKLCGASPTGAHIHAEPIRPPAQLLPTFNRPNHFGSVDIACARPKSRPGLTVGSAASEYFWQNHRTSISTTQICIFTSIIIASSVFRVTYPMHRLLRYRLYLLLLFNDPFSLWTLADVSIRPPRELRKSHNYKE